jgi:hypothetical protein
VNEYVDGHLSQLAEDAASLSAAEVDSILTLAEQWRTSAVWPEVRRGRRDANEYLHAVGILAVGTLLRERHQGTKIVVAKAKDREPDLMPEVSEIEFLAVEVKAPARLWHPVHALGLADSMHLVRAAMSSAGWSTGQLRAGRTGVLATSGLLVSQDTYDLLVQTFEVVLSNQGKQWPHILGLAIFNMRLRPELEDGRVTVAPEQQSVLRRNPNYQGRLWIDNDWSQQWRVVQR